MYGKRVIDRNLRNQRDLTERSHPQRAETSVNVRTNQDTDDNEDRSSLRNFPAGLKAAVPIAKVTP